MREYSFSVEGAPAAGMRVDKYLSDVAGLCSRSRLKPLLRSLKVNGVSVRLSHRLKVGDLVNAVLDDPQAPYIEAEPMELKVLYENADVLVLDKPQGVTVHPGSGRRHGTLVQGMMHYLAHLKEAFGDDVRPGIVHRLDKDTSGVIITAKNPEAHEFLARQFRNRETKKRYVAIVRGCPSADRGIIRANIVRDSRQRKRFKTTDTGGRTAVTGYQVLRRFEGYALIRCEPVTGRTHQIRVHLSSAGFPVVGDPVYGSRDKSLSGTSLMLHAISLSITLPGESERRLFHAPLPRRFAECVRTIQNRLP